MFSRNRTNGTGMFNHGDTSEMILADLAACPGAGGRFSIKLIEFRPWTNCYPMKVVLQGGLARACIDSREQPTRVILVATPQKGDDVLDDRVATVLWRLNTCRKPFDQIGNGRKGVQSIGDPTRSYPDTGGYKLVVLSSYQLGRDG